MKSVVAASLLCTATATHDWTPLKKYTIDLDKAPEDRWTEVVKDHKTYVKGILAILKGMFSNEGSKALLDAAVVSDEIKGEMQGVANVVGGGATWKDALMGTMFYELSAVSADLPEEWKVVNKQACTGIVAQNSNGTVFHARNQDYPPPFAPLQFDGTFVKDGKVVFEGTSFAGIVGIGGTCMSPGGFSISIDARDSFKPSVTDAVTYAKAGALSAPLITREACARGGDFESAIDYLSTTPMIDPLYFIVAGAKPGEGAIVSRNATADADVWRLKDGYPKDDPFYVVETNYDHWEDAPSSDDRRKDAICIMEEIGADNINMDTLKQVISDRGNGKTWKNCKSHRGVFNEATIHSELVIPAASDYRTYTRNPFDPLEDVVV